MTDKVKETASANTTAAARKQYNKGDVANRALKSAAAKPARGRRVPVVAAPAVAGGRKASAAPTAEELAEGGYVQPTGVDHSSGALDTPPPEAMPEVRKVAERKARGEKPEPEVVAKKGKRKASRKRK